MAHKDSRLNEGLFWLLIMLLVITPRVLDLNVFYARDELAIWPWADEFALAVWAGQPAETLTASDYPGIPLFWAQTLFLTLKYHFPALFPQTMIPLEHLFEARELDLLAERRLVAGLVVSGQIIACAWLMQRLFGRRAALLTAIFMGLDPFSLSEARVLRLEMISSLFVCLSLLSYLLYLRERRRGWLLLSGMMAGLGVSSKTSAGLLVPYIWLLLLLDLLFETVAWRRKFKQTFTNGLLWAVGAVSTFWAVWPAMWVRPVEVLQYLFGRGLAQAAESSVWHGDVFFWGQLYQDDPGPYFYPVALAFRTTPLTWLGVGYVLCLAALAFYSLSPKGSRALPSDDPLAPWERDGVRVWGHPWPAVAVGLLLAYVLLTLLQLTLVISKVDRFLLILFPALNLLAALGLAALISPAPSPIRLFAYSLILSLQLALTLPAHPYYFTYWNPLVGGGRAAMETVPIGAGEGVDQAMKFLNGLPGAGEAKLVCGGSQPWCAQTFQGETLRFASYTNGSWVEADYVSFYISHLQRRIYPPEVVDFFMAQEPLYKVELQGVTYMWVYEMPAITHFAGPANDLVGLGRLLGYTLSPPLPGGTGGMTGDTVTATVWWTNFGAGPDNLMLRWVDETGYEWGRAAVTPATQYTTLPAVITGTATLTIPPGTPPGVYFLRAGIVGAQGDLLGEFSLPDIGSHLSVTPGRIFTRTADFAIPHPLNRPVAPDLTLLGYAPPAQLLTADAPAWLTFYWQATAPPADHVFLVRLLDGDGNEVTRWQGRPAHGSYPTDTWQAGEIVQDVWALQAPPDIPPGLYRLELSLPGAEGIDLGRVEVWPQPVSYDMPAMRDELRANFGDTLTLLGYDLYFDTDGAGAGRLAPVLYWQSRADFEEMFDLRLTLRRADTGEVAQTWRVPLGGAEAKKLWKAGEVVTTAYSFEIGQTVAEPYHLDIALENRADGQPVGSVVRLENIQDKIVVRVR
jgi:4-amino-4-deoxy-L-arabinose transferase-like glycosyltransferase